MTAANDWARVVGLAYEPGGELPRVILKGVGPAADEIVRVGQQTGVEVIRNGRLVDQLFRMPTDDPIGPELFEVVALILTHVLAVDRKREGERP